MMRLAVVSQLARYFGPGWLVYRAMYAARQRLGLLRYRSPAGPWRPLTHFLRDEATGFAGDYLAYRREHAPPFFFSAGERERFCPYLNGWDQGDVTPVAVVEALQKGTLLYYNGAPAAIGFPPHWHRNPFTGAEAPATRHWSEIDDFTHGDIKAIWEASRFGFVYALVRAYWRTGDAGYPEIFWQLVEDWRLHNPPQQGANWKCGQETSFRVMAWLFGLYGFLESEATTAERISLLAAMIATSGERIEANLGYALSQRNNHGISEGMGLWTIGALFPEFEKAKRWEERGRRTLESQGRQLIYDDGAFSQHSLNYQRLMLHDYLWALRLGDIIGQPFSDGLRERVVRSGAFLRSLQLGEQGEAPRYGQNDGALILPLSNCDYQDFRPVIQAIHYLSNGRRLYPDGPWDEDLLWLFGERALAAPQEASAQEELQATDGGYYTWLTAESAAFVRCGAFRHRPSQADLLHVDIWWRGQNVAIDPGTYSYNAPEPWNNPLAETRYHNTVTVDGADQMERVSRFIWLPWAKGQVHHRLRSARGHLAYWEGEHDGYLRLKPSARYRRAVIGLGAAHWLVLDSLDSQAEHDYRLHWLLADYPFDWKEKEQVLVLTLPEGPYTAQVGIMNGIVRTSVVRADPASPRGWYAPYYQDRQPAVSLEASTSAPSALFWSCLGPGAIAVKSVGASLTVDTPSSRFIVRIGENRQDPLVSSIAATGGVVDTLDIPS